MATAKLEVRRYAHGDQKLWPLIGPWVTSREIHKALGGAVFSDDQTVWWVATRDGALVGWASLQESKGCYWLASAYVVPEERGEQAHAALAKARDEYLEGLPPRTVKVCCRMARWPHYQARGFHQDSVRGDWVYASKMSKPEPAGAK